MITPVAGHKYGRRPAPVKPQASWSFTRGVAMHEPGSFSIPGIGQTFPEETFLFSSLSP
jgi:hypothetical protein